MTLMAEHFEQPSEGGIRPQEPYIEAASLRCRDEYKLDPAAAPHSENVGGEALKRRHEEFSLLEHVGRPEMRRLFGELARSSHILLLTDDAGTILDVCADEANADLIRTVDMLPGFIWDEQHQGTNGPGTCLHDARPLVVHRNDHFFISNRRMTCSAAPIWGPNGRLLGVLNASRLESSESRVSQVPTIALVSFSARIIEQLYFTSLFPDCLIMRLHDQPTAVGLPQDSLFAVGNDGRVQAADSVALARLGISDPMTLVGRSVADLFDISVDRLFEQAKKNPLASWPISAGRGQQGYASVWPARRHTAHNVRTPDTRQPADRGMIPPRRAVKAQRSPFVAPPGCDAAVVEVIRRANLVMDRDINMVLQGETGTGKDTVARAIHHASARFDYPFIAVNCAAIPESLIESELFGYEAGAFTGARAGGMRGKVLAAQGGTLFLDEIGDMPIAIQPRLLQMLEEKQVIPLGSTRPTPVDIKIISATHRDLPALVARGGFRMDLYYRLNGVTLTLPPLREREDRLALIRAVCRNEVGDAVELDDGALAALMAYDWPGNIRELRNTLRTAMAFAESGRIEISHLPVSLRTSVVQNIPVRPVLSAGEASARARIASALEANHWRIGRTAEALGMSRNTLYRKLRQFGLMSP